MTGTEDHHATVRSKLADFVFMIEAANPSKQWAGSAIEISKLLENGCWAEHQHIAAMAQFLGVREIIFN